MSRDGIKGDPYGTFKFKPKDKVRTLKSFYSKLLEEIIPKGTIGTVLNDNHSPKVEFDLGITYINQDELEKVK